jgi:hypothetical protein
MKKVQVKAMTAVICARHSEKINSLEHFLSELGKADKTLSEAQIKEDLQCLDHK